MEEEDIFERMGMRDERSSNEIQRWFFCRDVNVSGVYHVPGSYDGRMSLPMMIVMLVLGFVTFFVNLGVIIRTIKILRHGHDNKPAFYFIGNLALSDLAIGLYIVISFLLHITNRTDLWQKQTCTLQIAVAVTACQETIFTITLIAVDKYLYICHAMKYHQIVTMTRVYVAVISSWMISLIIGSLPAMGMLVQWEETCGRCIFAQVVSKDFAVLFFVTAVVLPYAVSVSLYTILLLLALKMQKARYGGGYKINEESKSSYFRLSFMSKKSSRSRGGSVISNTKSITSRGTVSTTISIASGTSVSKTNRRRVRRQAMQEYKASLPKPEEIKDGIVTKLVAQSHITTQTNDDMKQKRNGVIHEQKKDTVTCLLEDKDLKGKESVPSPNTSHSDSDELSHSKGDIECSTIVITNKNINVLEEDSHKDELNSSTNWSDDKRDMSDDGNGASNVSGNVVFADLNYVNAPSSKQNSCDSPRESNSAVVDRVNVNMSHQLPSGASIGEGDPKPVLKQTISQVSDSIISSNSLPSLILTDEDTEEDDKPRWSVSKYFNRVVLDTKDKVLFLKKCRAVKTVFLIIGSFTVTYVPFVVGSLVYSLEQEKSKALLHALQTILFCAIVANSLVNPLLYAYGYREFRIRTEKFKGVFATVKQPKL